jgi:hypothetical protein
MKALYADVKHVTDAIEKLNGAVDLSGEDGRITVYPSGPVMRGITLTEARKRNLIKTLDQSVCSVKTDGVRWTMVFHQKITDGTFELRPVESGEQATRIEEIAPMLKPVVQSIEDEFNVISWDFCEVSAASIGSNGHFVDFEFRYVITSTEL